MSERRVRTFPDPTTPRPKPPPPPPMPSSSGVVMLADRLDQIHMVLTGANSDTFKIDLAAKLAVAALRAVLKRPTGADL